MTFVDSVVKQTQAVWSGDPRKKNREARRCWRSFLQIREFGDAGRDALAELFTHERADVRVTAAAFLLRHKTTEALKLLHEEAQESTLVGLEAEQAIARWRDGTWQLDP